MRSNASPPYSVRVPGAALYPEAADDVEDDVLRVDTAPERAVHRDTAHLQRLHRQTLRGEHVAHLGSPDAEGNGAEGPVCRGMAVAAGNRHPGLGQAELGADDVDDALVGVADVVQRNAELAAVLLERRHHFLGEHVEERPALVQRRHDVIHGGKRAVRKGHLAAAAAEHVERLRARDLVNEVQTDE